MTRITMTTDRDHVADRPRRCACGIPIIVTTTGEVLDDRASRRGEPHDACYPECVDLGAGDA